MDPQLPETKQPEPASPTEMTPTLSGKRLLTKRMWVIIGAVFVLLLLLLCISLVLNVQNRNAVKKAAAQTVDVEEHRYEATVTVSNTGYDPGTLTVKPDTEVFFLNQDKNIENEDGPTHRVVQSQLAPNHAPAFSSGQILAESGYGYVFRTAGTYKFFDADNSKETVTVYVK